MMETTSKIKPQLPWEMVLVGLQFSPLGHPSGPRNF